MSSQTDDRPMQPFLVLLSGQAVSLLGSQSVQFALIWWLTLETGSAVVLAAATFLGLVPQIVLGPFIGALVDRWNRKRILWVADAGVAAAERMPIVGYHMPFPGMGFIDTRGDGFHYVPASYQMML